MLKQILSRHKSAQMPLKGVELYLMSEKGLVEDFSLVSFRTETKYKFTKSHTNTRQISTLFILLVRLDSVGGANGSLDQ